MYFCGQRVDRLQTRKYSQVQVSESVDTVLCPKNLVNMWEDYREEYRLLGRVLSISQVINTLPDLRRYRLVMIDESHNLRNREGKRYQAIQEYIHENESKVILLSATPYNKTYLDLSNQLRLFVDETEDLGIRPEQYIKSLGGIIEFNSKHQSGIRTLQAFEHSEYIDDWRELMRRYLVRRTRSFIMDNYAETDPETKRKFLLFSDGTPSYFPTRVPKTITFTIDDKDPDDTYAQLYSPSVVNVISSLKLARYGLANYIVDTPSEPPTEAEQRQLQDLSRGGQRLMGFCRTNLFKRLESSRRPSGARFRTYERLKDYASEVEGTLLSTPALKQVIETIYRYPLRREATETLNRQLRSGISNEDLAALVIDLWETERLCIIEQERQTQEPQIVCSLGLRTT